MDSEKKIAVLIDADNVSYKYIKHILNELAKHGTPTYKRIYGDWTKPEMTSWKNVLLTFSITPIQQYNYTTGKNATDSALIIDAMDILYTQNVDSFCIVSSDSDFTKLASRLREAGMYVIGMGEKKTPNPFISACEMFKYLEVLADEERPPYLLHEAPSQSYYDSEELGITSIGDITNVMKTIVDETSEEDGWAFLGTVGNVLNKQHPDFDARNYGYPKLTNFVKSLGIFEVEHRKTNNPSVKHTFIRNAGK